MPPSRILPPSSSALSFSPSSSPSPSPAPPPARSTRGKQVSNATFSDAVADSKDRTWLSRGELTLSLGGDGEGAVYDVWAYITPSGGKGRRPYGRVLPELQVLRIGDLLLPANDAPDGAAGGAYFGWSLRALSCKALPAAHADLRFASAEEEEAYKLWYGSKIQLLDMVYAVIMWLISTMSHVKRWRELAAVPAPAPAPLVAVLLPHGGFLLYFLAVSLVLAFRTHWYHAHREGLNMFYHCCMVLAQCWAAPQAALSTAAAAAASSSGSAAAATALLAPASAAVAPAHCVLRLLLRCPSLSYMPPCMPMRFWIYLRYQATKVLLVCVAALVASLRGCSPLCHHGSASCLLTGLLMPTAAAFAQDLLARCTFRHYHGSRFPAAPAAAAGRGGNEAAAGASAAHAHAD